MSLIENNYWVTRGGFENTSGQAIKMLRSQIPSISRTASTKTVISPKPLGISYRLVPHLNTSCLGVKIHP